MKKFPYRVLIERLPAHPTHPPSEPSGELRPEQRAVLRAVAGTLRKLADLLMELLLPPESR